MINVKKGYYTYDLSKLESEIKISKAMINMFEEIQKQRNLSQREKDDLNYHKVRLITLEHDYEIEKKNLGLLK